MRSYRCYRCDYGHKWLVQMREDEKEHLSDSICPEGHDAVTCNIETPVDDVQVLISPAARIVDQVKKQRILNGRYYLSLLDNAGSEICSSKHDFDWDTAIKLASFFKDKSSEQALHWWRRREL